MSGVANLVRWEWFKLRRRWMPYILLVLLLLFSQLTIWGPYFGYRSLKSNGGSVTVPTENGRLRSVSCDDLVAGRAGNLPQGLDQRITEGLKAQCQQRSNQELVNRWGHFAPPGGIRDALRTAQQFGLALIAILTASVIGMEYGSGTLRAVLGQGTSRWRFLAGKLLMVALALAASLVLVVGLSAASSAGAQALAGPAPAGYVAPSWNEAAITLGKVWFSLLPYVALTGFLTVLLRSSAAGMAIGLGYYFAERILTALMSAFFDWFDRIRDYFPVESISALTGGFRFGGDGDAAVHLVRTSLTLAVYLVVFAAAAFWLFPRRDVAGASGG